MNHQREQFQQKVKEHMQTNRDKDMEHAGEERHLDHTKIEHHEEGKHPQGAPEGTMHTIHHHDGEVSHHPTMGHAAMHLAAKHDGGEHGHIMPHPGGGATTHHVGMDGEVQGPHTHPSEDEGYDHLKGNIGEASEMPMGDGDEDDSYASNGEESFM